MGPNYWATFVFPGAVLVPDSTTNWFTRLNSEKSLAFFLRYQVPACGMHQHRQTQTPSREASRSKVKLSLQASSASLGVQAHWNAPFLEREYLVVRGSLRNEPPQKETQL